MKLKVTAIDKEFANVSKKGQTYICVKITGTNLYDGESKTLMIYPFKEDLHASAREAEVGDMLNITYEKKPNGSFPISIEKMDGSTSAPTPAASTTTTYPKKFSNADSKQDSIVFQSCLKVAVEMLNHNLTSYTSETLIAAAAELAKVARDINLDTYTDSATTTSDDLNHALEEYHQAAMQADDDDIEF